MDKRNVGIVARLHRDHRYGGRDRCGPTGVHIHERVANIRKELPNAISSTTLKVCHIHPVYGMTYRQGEPGSG